MLLSYDLINSRNNKCEDDTNTNKKDRKILFKEDFNFFNSCKYIKFQITFSNILFMQR